MNLHSEAQVDQIMNTLDSLNNLNGIPIDRDEEEEEEEEDDDGNEDDGNEDDGDEEEMDVGDDDKEG